MSVSTASMVAAADGDRTAGRIGVLPFLFVLGQLAVLLVVIRQFTIESPAFLQVTALAFAGFAIHALLPLRYRLPLFLLLSLAAIGLVFGVVNGLTLIAIGLTLIGACHLPVSFGWRIAVLLALGAVLAALRANWLPELWSEAIWPILASMFMFRLIVYMYDLKHDKASVTPVRTLSYFFMLPNVCFPLFPVIDYKTFRRNYFDDDAYRIYQIGVDWMVRGVIHLLLYRYVYYYLTLSPAEVRDSGDIVQFCLSNFLLYLRVSGLFHLIVGMLYLFGFRLPETHHLYYLASSVSDLWRRINIYWKDFMLKVFYYPMAFRLRHLGATKAMVLATLFVFVMTWFLHAYQWFWLRGTALLEWPDILFWVILGALVVVNGLREIKYGRQRSLGKRSWTWQGLSRRAFNTVLTFSFICVLWSFWTSGSMTAWLSMWTVVAENSAVPGEPPSVLLFAALGLTLAQGAGGKDGSPMRSRRWPRWLDKHVLTAGSLVLLLLAGIEDLHSKIGGEFSTVISTLRSGKLSRLDEAQLERGYYEGLLSARSNSQLWDIYAKKPVRWLSVEGTGLKRFTNTFVQAENTPSFVAQTDFGPYSINRWGMRDKDYEKQRPANTFRAALLGASTIAGWGVGDGETFEAIVEDRLNKELAGSPYDKYEILNFGVPGYQPPQQLPTLERALTFDPMVVFYVATGREATRAANYLAEVVRKEIEIPYAPLKEIVTKAGLTPTTEETVALRNLDPFKAEILGWVYRHITEEARAHGAVPFFFFLPQATEGAWQTETPMILGSADAAGFEMIDLADVFKGHPVESYTLAEWDRHPNAFGHQLIATRIYDEIGARQDLMFGRQ